MNICEMCNIEHEKHDLISLSNIIISEEMIKKSNEQINLKLVLLKLKLFKKILKKI